MILVPSISRLGLTENACQSKSALRLLHSFMRQRLLKELVAGQVARAGFRVLMQQMGRQAPDFSHVSPLRLFSGDQLMQHHSKAAQHQSDGSESITTRQAQIDQVTHWVISTQFPTSACPIVV